MQHAQRGRGRGRGIEGGREGEWETERASDASIRVATAASAAPRIFVVRRCRRPHTMVACLGNASHCQTVKCPSQACFKGLARRASASRALAFRATGGGGDANAAAALAAAEKRGRCSTRRRRTCAGSSTSTTPSASPGPTPAPGTVVSCRPCSLSRLELGIPNLILGALDFNTKAGAAPPVWLAGRPAGRRSKVETKQF